MADPLSIYPVYITKLFLIYKISFLLGPIKGMKCTYIVEAEPYEHSWSDNFLCIPNDAPFDFDWSLAGPIRGKKCIQWMEPADPHTWSDNFLCM